MVPVGPRLSFILWDACVHLSCNRPGWLPSEYVDYDIHSLTNERMWMYPTITKCVCLYFFSSHMNQWLSLNNYLNYTDLEQLIFALIASAKTEFFWKTSFMSTYPSDHNYAMISRFSTDLKKSISLLIRTMFRLPLAFIPNSYREAQIDKLLRETC